MAKTELSTEESAKLVACNQIRIALQGAVLDTYLNEKCVELMVNSDGKVYAEFLGQSDKPCIGKIPPNLVLTVIRAVSGVHGQIVDYQHPICEGEFPLDGSRFEGLIPPAVTAPMFSLRKKATLIFSLDDYVKSKIMTKAQKNAICDAVRNKANILVVGGTGSGKTTLLNAIIKEMVDQDPDERPGIIEDTGELQCAAQNYFQLRAFECASMTALLKATLRLRPDRILVGEVRGAEALDLLDAWNTGHPGGCATIHSNSARSGLDRLKLMIGRNSQAPREIEPLIGEAVNVVVNIVRDHSKAGRVVKEIIEVEGWDSRKTEYNIKTIC